MSAYVNGKYAKLVNTETLLDGTYNLPSDIIYFTEVFDVRTAKGWMFHFIVLDGAIATYVLDVEISSNGIDWKTYIGAATVINSNYEDTFETAKNQHDNCYNYVRAKIRSQVDNITPKVIFSRK